MIEATVGRYFEAVASGFDPGLLGSIGVRLEDGLAVLVTARRVTGIIESPPASGIYTTTLLAPAVAGTYTVVWDDGDTFAPEQVEVTTWVLGNALDRLRVMMDAASDPTLSDDELSDLLAQRSLPDAEGHAPGAPDWVPTYAFEDAAAAGWTLKAGKLTGRTDIADEAAQVKRSQAWDHCIAMAKFYRGEADRVLGEADRVLAVSDAPLARFAAQAFEPLPRESARYTGTAP